jgi:CTP:molybdopterin cytidylyltransferase MocA
MNEHPHIAILAAGQGRRFGGEKLDTVVGGRPLGRYALDSALALGGAKPVLIVAQQVPAFARIAAEQGLADLLINTQASEGIATSVALAAASAASAHSQALLLLLADMPLVSAETLRRLVASVAPGHPSATRHVDGKPGIPACFPSDYFPALQQLQGDKGAAMLLRGTGAAFLIEVDASELEDVDTAEDLAGIIPSRPQTTTGQA